MIESIDLLLDASAIGLLVVIVLLIVIASVRAHWRHDRHDIEHQEMKDGIEGVRQHVSAVNDSTANDRHMVRHELAQWRQWLREFFGSLFGDGGGPSPK